MAEDAAKPSGLSAIQRVAAIAAPTITAFLGVCAILWYLFSIAGSVQSQGPRNDEFARRLGALETAAYPMKAAVDQAASETKAQDARNSDIYRRLDQAEARLALMTVTVATMKRDLNEIETQFCAADNIRNLAQANDLRNTALLWEKVFAAPYPAAVAFYARICNRQPAAAVIP